MSKQAVIRLISLFLLLALVSSGCNLSSKKASTPTATVNPTPAVQGILCTAPLEAFQGLSCFGYNSWGFSTHELSGVKSVTWSRGQTLVAGYWAHNTSENVWNFVMQVFQYNTVKDSITWNSPFNHTSVVLLFTEKAPFPCNLLSDLRNAAHDNGISETENINFEGELDCLNITPSLALQQVQKCDQDTFTQFLCGAVDVQVATDLPQILSPTCDNATATNGSDAIRGYAFFCLGIHTALVARTDTDGKKLVSFSYCVSVVCTGNVSGYYYMLNMTKQTIDFAN